MRLRRVALLSWIALAALGVASAGAWTITRRLAERDAHFADAADMTLATHGARLYRRECGSCHGAQLQGQAFWRLVDGNEGRRAPALDSTGPAWRRSDDELFRILKYGRREGKSATATAMPAYDGYLQDNDLVAIVAFVKATWPVGVRSLQATRNPGQRGMPAAANSDWRLPPTCVSDVSTVETP